jgi:hypothetical protein
MTAVPQMGAATRDALIVAAPRLRAVLTPIGISQERKPMPGWFITAIVFLVLGLLVIAGSLFTGNRESRLFVASPGGLFVVLAIIATIIHRRVPAADQPTPGRAKHAG